MNGNSDDAENPQASKTRPQSPAPVPERVGARDLEVAPRPPPEPTGTFGISRVVRRSIKAALARWVVQKQAPGDRCTQPEDEASHPWGGDRFFTEDYIFAVVQARFALFVRLEWIPGRDQHRVWIHLLTPQGVWVLPGSAGAVEQVMDGNHWRAAGLAIDCQKPHRRWSVRFHGQLQPLGTRGEAIDGPSLRCGFDFEFESASEPYIPGTDDDPAMVARHLGEANWDLELLRSLRRRRLRGYNQSGEVVGTVSIGMDLIPLYASCLRVHTWGPRDWGGSDTALQAFGSLAQAKPGSPGPHQAQRFWIHQAKFPWVTLEGGWVQAGQGLTPIADIGITREQTPGRPVRRAGLTLVHALGEWEIEAEAIAHHSFDIDGRGRMTVTLARFTGGHQGWGLWVSLRRIVPGQRRLTG